MNLENRFSSTESLLSDYEFGWKKITHAGKYVVEDYLYEEVNRDSVNNGITNVQKNTDLTVNNLKNLITSSSSVDNVRISSMGVHRLSPGDCRDLTIQVSDKVYSRKHSVGYDPSGLETCSVLKNSDCGLNDTAAIVSSKMGDEDLKFDSLLDYGRYEPELTEGVLFSEDLAGEEEVWLVHCPLTVPPNALLNQHLVVDGTSRMVSTSTTGVDLALEAKMMSVTPIPTTCLLPSQRNGGIFKTVTLRPARHLVITEEVAVPEADNFVSRKHRVVMPNNLKARHPLFGADFEDYLEPTEGNSYASSKIRGHHGSSVLVETSSCKKESNFTNTKKSTKKKRKHDLGEWQGESCDVRRKKKRDRGSLLDDERSKKKKKKKKKKHTLGETQRETLLDNGISDSPIGRHKRKASESASLENNDNNK